MAIAISTINATGDLHALLSPCSPRLDFPVMTTTMEKIILHPGMGLALAAVEVVAELCPIPGPQTIIQALQAVKDAVEKAKWRRVYHVPFIVLSRADGRIPLGRVSETGSKVSDAGRRVRRGQDPDSKDGP